MNTTAVPVFKTAIATKPPAPTTTPVLHTQLCLRIMPSVKFGVAREIAVIGLKPEAWPKDIRKHIDGCIAVAKAFALSHPRCYAQSDGSMIGGQPPSAPGMRYMPSRISRAGHQRYCDLSRAYEHVLSRLDSDGFAIKAGSPIMRSWKEMRFRVYECIMGIC